MRVISVLSLLLAAATNLCQAEYDSRKYHQFDNGTWIEDIAGYGASWYVKFSRYDRPIVYQVDTAHQHGPPQPLYTFPDSIGLTGITELGYERYAILARTKVNGHDASSLWTLSNNGSAPQAVKLIEKIGNGGTLNGLTTLSSTVVLASNTLAGVVYRLDLQTRTVKVVLKDPTMAKGINGVRYRAPYLYYTNSVQGLFARIPIDPITAEPTGKAQVVSKGASLVGADSFTLAHWSDDAFVANFQRNTVVRVNTTAKAAEVVVRNIPAPCSAAFGSSGGFFYLASV
ncbi:hypothetical protein EYZ11_011534 [Aspergillus tanneri]|uniref:Uncharacterized protein n=1 Tax=Aspergillus tanneri TaxID=1220188 RepID=A0A4V3UMX9_9EURO|nr:hypothetical protein EYZ11_011534 [Aspergillus tanneri]